MNDVTDDVLEDANIPRRRRGSPDMLEVWNKGRARPTRK
jgi:hypothetical protein